MVEYLNLKPRHVDSTDLGGASRLSLVSHAAQAIAAGKCSIALITLAGRPYGEGVATGLQPKLRDPSQPDFQWEYPYGIANANGYAMCAKRHMYEYGTTSEQLAWIKVAASHHAQHNPNALLRQVLTVADVLASPMVADPLHRLDCCVVTDGGGALIVARPEIARSLKRPLVKIRGAGETVKHQNGGYFDLTTSGARQAGAQAFAEANVTPLTFNMRRYDSFTITVLIQLEDLDFRAPGQGLRVWRTAI